MSVLFYGSAIIAILSTLLVITRTNIVHALLYFIVSLLAIAVIFYTLGAPFAAALEVIVYAGAIMVMFLFVVMMLNLGHVTQDQEKAWLVPSIWIGPSLLAIPLLIEVIYAINLNQETMATKVVGPKEVGIALFGPYVLAVELASMLLLAGLVGAYHLARK
ncbi:MAG: NADH-quinone oxidoreductase subunit J [Gammaproteobacteria bacterium]|jgi:NADH-quinone oxidoreductase subunit J|nr:NADH-quinone oxidoreductase subunit J [Gammaproteobacteria bacterium]MBT6041992.1 NADH-quinone oxidoreductase subunit J [Gammaproteobacteria bacterium]